MNPARIEAFLARIYVDPAARSRFSTNPFAEAKSAGLSDEECRALEHTDWVGLEMAARSFAHKRSLKRPRISSLGELFSRLFRLRN